MAVKIVLRKLVVLIVIPEKLAHQVMHESWVFLAVACKQGLKGSKDVYMAIYDGDWG
jgi:hypothetical protein